MKIPTENDFKEALCFDLFDTYLEGIEDLDPREVSNKEIEDFAHAAWNNHLKRRAEFHTLPAAAWLTSQAPYKMALKQIFSEWPWMNAEWLAKSFIEDAEKIRLSKTFKPFRPYRPFSDLWTHRLLDNLDHYHYTDPVASVKSSKDYISKLIKQAAKILPTIDELSQDIFIHGYNPKDSIVKDDDLENLARNLRDATRKIKEASDSNCLYPSTRDDETVRERFFIHHMCSTHYDLLGRFKYIGPSIRPKDWKENNSYWRFSVDIKHEAISNLLYLDGIKNTIDIRNVEMHCKSFLTKQSNRTRIRNGENEDSPA